MFPTRSWPDPCFCQPHLLCAGMTRWEKTRTVQEFAAAAAEDAQGGSASKGQSLQAITRPTTKRKEDLLQRQQQRKHTQQRIFDKQVTTRTFCHICSISHMWQMSSNDLICSANPVWVLLCPLQLVSRSRDMQLHGHSASCSCMHWLLQVSGGGPGP